MAGGDSALTGPDFSRGVDLAELEEGVPLLGHVDGQPVMLVLVEGAPRAVGASCTHYGGPLAQGLVRDGTVRCPWHHACFALDTGEALAAPALSPLPVWAVEVHDGRVLVGSRTEHAPLSARGRRAPGPDRVAIVGAGAAGSAAAEWLRREGFEGDVALIDPDPDAPYDRPNLSKDYLAGSAPEEWIPLRPPGFYREAGIRRVVDRAVRLDREKGLVELGSGEPVAFDVALLATGALPRTLTAPGADLPHVHTLRSLADCRRIVERATHGPEVVVVGASFIGMEAAAALRTRGLDVTVVAPEDVPFGRILGDELGARLRDAHVAHGVRFRLGRTVRRIEPSGVVLDDGTELSAGLVVVGVGVRPDTALAEAAGLTVEDGVHVDERLRTSDPRIYAAGDSARWMDPRSGRRARIEHWVVAQRQGQAAARSILGRAVAYRDVPFFWTQQHDLGVAWVGRAGPWDRVEVERGPDGAGRAFRYFEGDRLLALATIAADRLSLETEADMARELGLAPAELLR